MTQNNLSREIVRTDDGSSSIYVKELDEHYHSTHGAIQEAKHVFIEAGLSYVSEEAVRILEIGFGTVFRRMWKNQMMNAKTERMQLQIQF